MNEVPESPASDVPGVAQLLADWLSDLERAVRTNVKSATQQELTWRPHPDANNVSVTVWHFSRWLDVVGRIWHSDDHHDELWWRDGWVDRIGYDPSGMGFLGLGAVTGYTPAEAREVPEMDADTILAYLRDCVIQLRKLLGDTTNNELAETAPGLGAINTRYAWLTTVLQGSFGHLGEIEALIALHRKVQSDDPRPLKAE